MFSTRMNRSWREQKDLLRALSKLHEENPTTQHYLRSKFLTNYNVISRQKYDEIRVKYGLKLYEIWIKAE